MPDPISLRADSPLPLYYQLEQALRARIDGGEWGPGDPIASERDLMQAAGVSRATVRQAIGNLIAAGLLERSHGRGTFVARPKLEQEMAAVYSFAAQIGEHGQHLEDRLLCRELVPATDELAEMLAVDPGTPLIRIERVRLLGNVPLMLDRSFLPYHRCPGLLVDPFESPLYGMLTRRYDLPPTRCRDVLEPVVADAAQADVLRVEPGAPLMSLERITYTRGDEPLHLARNLIPGSRCRFRVNLWSNAPGGAPKGGVQLATVGLWEGD